MFYDDENPCYLISLPTFENTIFLKNIVILVGCSIAYGFICISLMTGNLEHLFMNLLAFWKSFVKSLLVYFAHF